MGQFFLKEKKNTNPTILTIDTAYFSIRGDDDNVPAWHSRQAIDILKSWNPSADVSSVFLLSKLAFRSLMNVFLDDDKLDITSVPVIRIGGRLFSKTMKCNLL